jgi:hypothetical protein
MSNRVGPFLSSGKATSDGKHVFWGRAKIACAFQVIFMRPLMPGPDDYVHVVSAQWLSQIHHPKYLLNPRSSSSSPAKNDLWHFGAVCFSASTSSLAFFAGDEQ